MNIKVEEVEKEKENNIVLRISGFDIQFFANPYGVSIYFNEDIADKIAFQISSLLQDIERRKKK